MTALSDVNIVLRVSHQFDALPADFRDGFAAYEFNDVESLRPIDGDRLVHTNLALIDPDVAEQVKGADTLRRLADGRVRRFSLDIGPCYEKVRAEGGQYHGEGEKLPPDEVLARAARRFESIRDQFPDTCQVAIENLNFYPSGAYDGVCDGPFYARACEKLGVGLVLDLAHAWVSAMNSGQRFEDFLAAFDFSTVREIHVSGPGMVDGLAVDGHALPGDREFGWLENVLAEVGGPVDVVIEYYRDVEGIVQSYERLRAITGAN